MKEVYYVEIYDFLKGPNPRLLGTIEWDGKSIAYSDETQLMKSELEENGIRIGGKILFPKDGMNFLKVLKIQYSGSYFRASDVKKKILMK
jgi:hypothetical protein